MKKFLTLFVILFLVSCEKNLTENTENTLRTENTQKIVENTVNEANFVENLSKESVRIALDSPVDEGIVTFSTLADFYEFLPIYQENLPNIATPENFRRTNYKIILTDANGEYGQISQKTVEDFFTILEKFPDLKKLYFIKTHKKYLSSNELKQKAFQYSYKDGSENTEKLAENAVEQWFDTMESGEFFSQEKVSIFVFFSFSEIFSQKNIREFSTLADFSNFFETEYPKLLAQGTEYQISGVVLNNYFHTGPRALGHDAYTKKTVEDFFTILEKNPDAEKTLKLGISQSLITSQKLKEKREKYREFSPTFQDSDDFSKNLSTQRVSIFLNFPRTADGSAVMYRFTSLKNFYNFLAIYRAYQAQWMEFSAENVFFEDYTFSARSQNVDGVYSEKTVEDFFAILEKFPNAEKISVCLSSDAFLKNDAIKKAYSQYTPQCSGEK